MTLIPKGTEVKIDGIPFATKSITFSSLPEMDADFSKVAINFGTYELKTTLVDVNWPVWDQVMGLRPKFSGPWRLSGSVWYRSGWYRDPDDLDDEPQMFERAVRVSSTSRQGGRSEGA